MGIKLAKGGGSNQYGEPYGFDNDDDDFTAYYWKETQDKNGKITGYDVIEKDTQQIVYQTTSRQKALEYIDRNRYGYAKGGAIQEGDWVAGKKSTVRGKVYEEMGEFVKLEDKYGNKNNTMYSKKELKHSSQPRYAKGGKLKYYDKETEYRLGRPSGSIEKEILEKVKYYTSSDELFMGSFGWITPSKKSAEGYLYKLDDYDINLLKDIKLKDSERIFRYLNRTTAIGGMVSLIKINLDKELVYFLADSENDEIVFETRGVPARYIALIEHKMARGGVAKSGWKHRMKK